MEICRQLKVVQKKYSPNSKHTFENGEKWRGNKLAEIVCHPALQLG